MKLPTAITSYNNISEIWRYSDNILVLTTISGRIIKITTIQNLYSNSPYKYEARFEEEQNIELQGKLFKIWTSLPLTSPVPGGATMEQCMENAIHLVNEGV